MLRTMRPDDVMRRLPQYELSDGVHIPFVGFGTYPLRGEQAATAVAHALSLGYRLIDTAVNYQNERDVGLGITRSRLDREDVFVTTKVPGRCHGYNETKASCRQSIEALRCDYLDLYLIHWPNPSVNKFVDSWRAMISLKDDGLVRTIGVSNFTQAFVGRLADETGVLPAVNQIEMHPYFPQAELRAFDDERGIRTEAWSPLGRAGELLREPSVVSAATRHGVTAAQVVLRWHLQQGVIPIPKSESPVRQAENLDLFGFELERSEVEAISWLGRHDGRLFDADPNTHEEM